MLLAFFFFFEFHARVKVIYTRSSHNYWTFALMKAWTLVFFLVKVFRGFRSAEVQTSAREFLHGPDISFTYFTTSTIMCYLNMAICTDCWAVPTQFVLVTSPGTGTRIRFVCTAFNNLPMLVITCVTQCSYGCLSFYPSLESTGWKDIFKNFIDQVNSII